MIDPEKIAEELACKKYECVNPAYDGEDHYKEGVADGIRYVLSLLYAEVKPEELVEGKWYWIRNCLIGTWSAEQYGGEMKAVIDYCSDTLMIRGPILPPSEVLQAAEEGE